MVPRAVALVVLLAAATASAQTITDEHPKIELVTMGNGALMWERHGHIAMCVTQNGLRSSLVRPEPGDGCYNYGIADFAHPINMAWGFVRGTRSFWVGKDLPSRMLEHYRLTDRTIWVQPLPFDVEQKTKVIAKLEDDIRDEHRFYAYDHFEDNCTTRIRDIIDNVTDHALSKMLDDPGDKTFRGYARDGFYGIEVPLLVTDIVMGHTTDRVPTYWERMFLPQYLREAVQTKWGVPPYLVYERKECAAAAQDPSCVARGIPTVKNPSSGRWLLALVIVILTAPVWLTRRLGRLLRTGLAISVVPYAMLGSLLTVIAIVSPLPYLRLNEMILVWFPIDLAVVVLSPQRQVKYAKGRVAMLALIAVLLLLDVLHQPLWVPLLWPSIPMATLAFWPNRA